MYLNWYIPTLVCCTQGISYKILFFHLQCAGKGKGKGKGN